MIEKISLAVIGESGEVVPLEKERPAQIEIKIELAIADLFSKICRRNNSIDDEEIKIAEKFNFAVNLKNYLEEMRDDRLD
jgi:hypothetical protein